MCFVVSLWCYFRHGSDFASHTNGSDFAQPDRSCCPQLVLRMVMGEGRVDEICVVKLWKEKVESKTVCLPISANWKWFNFEHTVRARRTRLRRSPGDFAFRDRYTTDATLLIHTYTHARIYTHAHTHTHTHTRNH